MGLHAGTPLGRQQKERGIRSGRADPQDVLRIVPVKDDRVLPEELVTSLLDTGAACCAAWLGGWGAGVTGSSGLLRVLVGGFGLRRARGGCCPFFFPGL